MSCELGEEERSMETGEECARDENGCVTEGHPLHWASPCVNYAVQADGSAKAGIDGAALQEAGARAFAAWEGALCASGGRPRFHAQFQGFVRCARREAVCGGAEKNVNVLMFHDQGWSDNPAAIGLTTPNGGTVSGLVVDADVQLNSQNFDFASDRSKNGFQLPDVLTHEVGHFLGLAHSNAPGALMSVGYEMVTHSEELLTADDVAAICAAYPPGPALDCKAPPPPAYDECQVVPGEPQPDCKLSSMIHDNDSSGCSVGAAQPSQGLGFSPAFIALLWLHRRRRMSVAV